MTATSITTRKLIVSYLLTAVPICATVFGISLLLPSVYGIGITYRIATVGKVPLVDKTWLGMTLQDPAYLNRALGQLHLPTVRTSRDSYRYIEILHQSDPSLLPVLFYGPTASMAKGLASVMTEEVLKSQKTIYTEMYDLKQEELQKYERLLRQAQAGAGRVLADSSADRKSSPRKQELIRPLQDVFAVQQAVYELRESLLPSNTFESSVFQQDEEPTRLGPRVLFNVLFSATLIALLFLVYALVQYAIRH